MESRIASTSQLQVRCAFAFNSIGLSLDIRHCESGKPDRSWPLIEKSLA